MFSPVVFDTSGACEPERARYAFELAGVAITPEMEYAMQTCIFENWHGEIMLDTKKLIAKIAYFPPGYVSTKRVQPIHHVNGNPPPPATQPK